MRHLLTCTALAPVLAVTAGGAGHAETTIGTARTTPVLTSTVANGQPDSVLINASGSVTVTSGAAVTMDSNHGVNNAGKISIKGANNSTGIRANAGTSGHITNSGTITLDEDYTPTDTDNDGDLDGPFAQGSGRNAIHAVAGAPHTGNIVNSGTLTVEGNQSAGIRLDSALSGALSNSGGIAVTGDNSFGIRAQDVSGDVSIRGSAAVKGKDAVGAAMLGDIGGALKIQGAIISTAYRSTTAPSDVSKLDADDLLQGGPAVRIAGNVAGGIIFDTAPADTDPAKDDEDNDGIKDSEEGNAAIASYGSAPAVEIGAADRDITVGAVAGNSSGYGLIVKGAAAGIGVYKGVDATGIQVGGLGGDVTIAKGMSISGNVAADSLDSNATALRIGSGAHVGEIAVSGSVAATGASLDNKNARGIAIDAGATVTRLSNSGTIGAAAKSDKGGATAVLDASGTLTSVENKGKIEANGAAAGRNIAIDLRQNASGVTISQTALSATATAPSIKGDIHTGSGNDLLTASAGSITGNSMLGGGNDSVQLSGTAAYTGNISYGPGTGNLSLSNNASVTGDVDFGGGAGSLSIADTGRLSGKLLGGGNVNVTLTGGTLDATNTGNVALASLTAGANSSIGVTVDSATNTHTTYDVVGAASFAAGSKVRVRLTEVASSIGDYTIVRAGSLSGAPTLDQSATILPYMFKGSVAGNAANGQVTLSIARKTTAELGLNGSQSRAYDAIFNALDNDAAVAQSFLAISDGGDFRQSVRQMLPDHAGGTFEAVTAGSRATARILADPGGIFRTDHGFGFWLQQVAWGGSKSIGSTSSYDIDGWGASGGGEIETGFGNVGLSLAYLHGTDSDGGNDNSVSSDQYELGGHWRGGWGKLQAFARLSYAMINFKGQRRFVGNNGAADVRRLSKGEWDGKLFSASAGASYEMTFGRFSLRPSVGIDHYRLKEDGYSETGGGDAFNLIVAGRKSDETTASGNIALGYDFGSLDPQNGWIRFEVEGGRRQIIGGSLGDTTARFKDGDPFTLVAEDRTNGWTGKVRLTGGSDAFRLGGEFSAEEQQDHVALAFRASLSFAM